MKARWEFYTVSAQCAGVQYIVGDTDARCYLTVKGKDAQLRAKRLLAYLEQNRVKADPIGDSK